MHLEQYKRRRKQMRTKKLVSIFILALVLSVNTLSAFAATTTKTITIPALGNGYTKKSATRSGNYSYVTVKCKSVYPTGTYKEDNFKKIRVKIFNSSTKGISNQYTLIEGQAATPIKILEGYLSIRQIQFGFCGNSENYKAETVVSYNPN